MNTLAWLEIAPGMQPWAEATLRSLAAASVTCSGIVVAAEALEPTVREALAAAAGSTPLVIVDSAQAMAALRERLRDERIEGVVRIAAGMALPHAFDARLVRAAQLDPAIGTVSPFCDGSAAHRLRDEGLLAESVDEAARLDRLAFLLGARSTYPVADALAQCCFITRSAFEHGAAADVRHVLCDALYVGRLPGALSAPAVAGPATPDPDLAASRAAIVAAWRAGRDYHAAPGADGRAVQLHVTHGLGGGSEKWLQDFARTDSGRVNLVLRSFSQAQAAGSGIALYTDVRDAAPLRVWKFAVEIAAAAISHPEYRAALDALVAEYCVDAVLVSSLIGHSLDVLRTGLPTRVVTHDYFPYCPAINLYFGAVCGHCDGERVAQCASENGRFNAFADFNPAERLAVRESFMQAIAQPEVGLASPSRSVLENLARLDARFGEVASVVIPHGYARPLRPLERPAPHAGERLRIVVLGQLSVAKGVELLREALDELTQFAEIYLLGCRELGELFRFHPHVHVNTQYAPQDLPQHMANINPHVGLLMSIVAETFSFALSELFMLGIPVAATRVGSFPERIREGETGYLFAPDAISMAGKLHAVDRDRAGLERIRANLRDWAPRSAAEMVADYHLAMPLGPRAPARYLPRDAQRNELPVAHVAFSAQVLEAARLWKEVKRLNLEGSVAGEARADAFKRFTGRVEALEARLLEAEAAIAAQKAGLIEREAQVRGLASQLAIKGAQLDEIRASTSWRITGPMRSAGHGLRKARILARCALVALRQPADLPRTARRLAEAWRAGGLHEVKRSLLALQPGEGRHDAWTDYQENFRREVRPRIVERIAGMGAGPRISVLVPTFDTPEAMLREMLDSVLSQLYPHWELCVADDGSSAPHVARILREYAARDRRIRVDFAATNRGVSHASNRALAMASADFVVLLDHDDLLEEQALFRVAECIAAEDPDLVYSDEVLVSADGAEVRRYAYRPAFSLEYLRSHPYIVHLVGLRTRLAREIGGFDEEMRISQDYDLILRAAERARTLVHIPEILYRWRLHGGSAGTARMAEVMQASRDVLRRHLERSGDAGRVGEGSRFNLFDVRYPLRADLNVAIIIPTRNHGRLLRQCIDSLRATLGDVRYALVVVDHESDEPATLAYLASLAGEARVLRYAGAFNFSAINNFAVAQLGGAYSHYLFCNNDIEAIAPGWLERMLELGQQPSVGIVGAKLLYPDRHSIQHAGVCVGAYGAAEHYAKRLRFPDDPIEPGFAELLLVNHEVAAVTAACMLVRRDAFEEVGGYDEEIAVGFGDVDLCLRVGERGYRIVFCPHAELVHHESYTRGTSTVDPHPEDSATFRFKWQEVLQAGDPFHNPGLSLTSSNWALCQPLTHGFAIRRRITRRGAAGRAVISFSAA